MEDSATIPAPAKSSTTGGKLAVLAIFALALVMASFAWWWNFNRGHRALEFYGAEAATLIRTAPKVELLVDDTASDLSKAPGLLNARTSLLADASYDWKASIVPLTRPAASVRFTNGTRTATIDFDFDAQAIRAGSTDRTAILNKKTSDGWRKFLQRNSPIVQK